MRSEESSEATLQLMNVVVVHVAPYARYNTAQDPHCFSKPAICVSPRSTQTVHTCTSCTYVYVHVHMCTCVHVHVYVHVHMCMYVHAHVSSDICCC